MAMKYKYLESDAYHYDVTLGATQLINLFEKIITYFQ